MILFTGGSNYVQDGVTYAGAGVVTLMEVIWAQCLPQETSDQKAELTAMTQALTWGNSHTVNIYTDNQYGFAMAHSMVLCARSGAC